MMPRPEYPRPQLVRETWMNLNGPWQFEIDHGDSGRARGLLTKPQLDQQITVPFCPESALSGIQYKDFMAAVWYRRALTLPQDWCLESGRVFLNFGAVDYDAEVWVNQVSVGTHKGGYSSFSLDITSALTAGENTITVCARDDVRSGWQPRGKQSSLFHSHACDYTRTTGIWQTVWAEYRPAVHIQSIQMLPDPDNSRIEMRVKLNKGVRGAQVSVKALFEGREVGAVCAQATGEMVAVVLPVSELHLWQLGSPNLYNAELTLSVQGEETDHVESYFGMRSVSLIDGAICLNGKPVFQRLILDQGFYPEGIYTAPTDEELKADILRSMAMGFNGARLHEKVFEERFLYWADVLGYLVWGEMGNWGLNHCEEKALTCFLPEWIEAVQRDFNHPALVGWCPFNETWDLNGRKQADEVIRQVYLVTKAMDPTRPVIDTSGNYHTETDIYDIHDYDQNPETFAQHYGPQAGNDFYERFPDRQERRGEPFFVSEFGGIWWQPGGEGWGYGERPQSEEEFLARYKGLVDALLDNPNMCAFCYTQLTDVEQEVNGLYTYHRVPKFDPQVIHAINSRRAAIEGE